MDHPKEIAEKLNEAWPTIIKWALRPLVYDTTNERGFEWDLATKEGE